jgi:hypothetical protein
MMSEYYYDYRDIEWKKCFVLDGREVNTETEGIDRSSVLIIDLEHEIYLVVEDCRNDQSGVVEAESREKAVKIAKYILHGIKRSPREQIEWRIEKSINPLYEADEIKAVDENIIAVWKEDDVRGYVTYSGSYVKFESNV